MANALPQAEMDLGPRRPVRLLHFSYAKTGRFFIDVHGDHVYEIEAVAAGQRHSWRASIRHSERCETVGLRCFADLGSATDWLQAEAVRLGRGAR